MVQLGGFRDRLPRQLSGGQQQRVALARALAVEPTILLLDEPFAALDRNLRLDMQIEIKRLQRQLGLTTILVTHDQDEAMSVADRIAVMNGARSSSSTRRSRSTTGRGRCSSTASSARPTCCPARSRRSKAAPPPSRSMPARRCSLPAPAASGAGAAVLLSVRPEQLALSSDARPRTLAGRARPQPADRRADSSTRSRTADGASLKIVEPRLARAATGAARVYCGLAADARPSLFPRPPDSQRRIP